MAKHIINGLNSEIDLRQPIGELTWDEQLEVAITTMLATSAFRKNIHRDHVQDTPRRVVRAFEEYFSGLNEDPAKVLSASFIRGKYDQMVIVDSVDFVSFCAHHLAPFIGTYTFGYLPDKHIVGISKIPRMVDVLCHRPQVQEKLSEEIVNVFYKTVKPKGCGVVMNALHTCACIRGVRKRFNTRTTALKGVFQSEGSVKAEFLQGVNK